MPVTLRRLLQILREPVLAATRANLARSWARVPERYRTRRQMLGRGGNGCSATIGAMPRCDFACTGCYLNAGANEIPPLDVAALCAQIDAVVPAMGDAGNLQLTDGEVTLRPVEELVTVLRHAVGRRLIPMLMTHGDSFRRRPGLLERLMTEGGLTEVSIHVDTTQRGRLGAAYKHARREAELHPLRDEFADLIRRARRTTGRPLRAATTMTVTAGNLDEVASVTEWLLHNSDAFRLISFQPVAQVGRTVDGLGGGCSVEALWGEVAKGLFGPEASEADVESLQQWVGHPACNRYLPGVVVREPGRRPRFFGLRREGDAMDMRAFDGFLDRFGGISFRMDTPAERWTRLVALLVRAPGFLLGTAPAFAWHWLRRFDPVHPWRFLWKILTGRATVGGLVFVSHHFMSEGEGATPAGRERLDLCVFHVPIDGRLVPMCEVNTTTIRRDFYDRLAARRALPVMPT